MISRLKYELHYQHRCLRLCKGFLRRGYIHCNMQVTYRCNFQCQICDFWQTEHDPAGELTLEEVRAIGEKLSKLGAIIISLGGGEPLIREDLYQVIGILNETGHFPILITNGWFVDETVARDILNAGLQEISVSVDYADPERHDAQRGQPGSWKQALRALELLHRNRPDRRNRVHMITTLMDDNLADVEALIRLSRELGVTYMVSLYSSGRGAKTQRVPDGKVTPHLLDLKARYPEFVSLTSYVERFDEAILHGGIGDCEGGRLSLNIGSRGEVSRCIDTLDEPVGNLLTDDVFELRDRLWQAQSTNDCGECWTSCRGFAECLYAPPRLRQFREFYHSVKRQ